MNPTRTIAWPQVIVLLLLNIFLIKSWLIYDNFQPQLLVNFSLQDRKFHFDIVHLLVMVLVPVFAGGFSDRFFRNNSSKFLLITVGMSVTAVIFMATGSVVQVNNSAEGTPWLSTLFLGLFTLWMIGMNFFNSPANSFLEKYAPASSLPLIVGIYTLLAELTLAFEPRVAYLVGLLGVVPTLVGAGCLLALLAFVFFKINNKAFAVAPIEKNRDQSGRFVAIVITGLILGAVLGLVKYFIPSHADGVHLDPFYILVISALCAVPVGLFLENGRLGLTYLFGLGMVIVILPFLKVYGFLSYACLGMGLSAMSVSAFPLVLRWAHPRYVALCTGLFFGAAELSEGIIELVCQ